MPSRKQIEANQQNAQKSTGPKTLEGKAASSMNALKTGLHAESEVLPSENRADYEALAARFYADFRPTTAMACQYVDEIVYCTWNIRRLRRAEQQIYGYVHQECWERDEDYPLGQPCVKDARVFSQLQWRIDANRRALDRARQNLIEVQAADRKAAAAEPQPDGPAPATCTNQPASPQNGFVPDTLSLPPAAPPSIPPQPPENPRIALK